MFASGRPAMGAIGRVGQAGVVLAVLLCGLAAGAERPSRSTADSPAVYRPETEIDISGPYHAWIDGEGFPSALDIWGPKATLRISMDGQDKPMTGMFLNDHLKVVAKYGAENFNLTTMVQAVYDGWNFNGRYSRIDEKLGARLGSIILSPEWPGGSGGGEPVKMPLPRRTSDIPGTYGLSLTRDGRTISARAEFEVDRGTVKLTAGGRVYECDYSDQQMFPLYWVGNRMDTFRLKPTETGFEGTLVKEVSGRQEEYKVVFVKAKGGGGGGHDRDWTYVYDAIINNAPPVWIAKLTMHDEEAKLVIDINDQKASMTGSLVEGILSGTGSYGRETVSIRAQKNPLGFAGFFRKGSGSRVQEAPIVLRNRPARVTRAEW